MASSAAAISFPNLPDISSLVVRKNGGGSGSGSGSDPGSCPAVWNQISRDLTAKFLTRGECNPDARAAIRAVFHDCGAWNVAQGAKGGCDGSLVLAGELNLPENKGLDVIGRYLQSLAKSYKVSLADMIVFAGSHAIVTCPGGPRVKTYIGRTDSSVRAPPGLLPDVRAPADSLFKLFQDKGLDAVDLAALLGAHTTSNQFNFDTTLEKKGLPQDSTPGVWDVKYYSETTNPPQGVLVLPSDSGLAVHPTVGKEFQGFVNNAGKWNGKFADAMARMELFGSAGTNGMADCTNALPSATNIKRELKGMPIFASRN
ncbi:heme peroxidase [Boeremia exigua]|uniref:heme peroxidase n=1 Tax=Boeremia exigua TaxID=749465 RepID=UPI001E8DE194|nr:heme peroxidase [Boeremia exigua]KAH6629683.1 heme peroxidase [Boeremia exigua]